MGESERLRDSTQIVVDQSVLESVDTDLETEFEVTVTHRDDHVHIVGSPVVIKEVGAYLARHGINIQ